MVKEDFRKAKKRTGQDGERRDSWDWSLKEKVTVSLKEVKVGPVGIMEAKVLNSLEKYRSKVIAVVTLPDISVAFPAINHIRTRGLSPSWESPGSNYLTPSSQAGCLKLPKAISSQP